MKRRRLGQHYLVDEQVIHRLVDEAGIRPDEKVLEIGTGRGALTKALAGRGATLEGYEIDRRNYASTVATVSGAEVRIKLGDAFSAKPRFDVLVASLPFSRSAVFVDWLSGIRFDRAVVILQEDFVKKMMAKTGARDYRAVSVLAQMCFTIKVLGRVGRAAFSPPPRVSALIVQLTPKSIISKSEASAIKLLFSLRRRRVSAALAKLGMDAGKGTYGSRRVNSLTLEEVHRLCSASPGSEGV